MLTGERSRPLQSRRSRFEAMKCEPVFVALQELMIGEPVPFAAGARCKLVRQNPGAKACEQENHGRCQEKSVLYSCTPLRFIAIAPVAAVRCCQGFS